MTSFHRPHTCSLRRFELSRSEARAAKAHVQMRAWQEASRGTPWDSSPPTAGGRPETVGERVGEAGFGGWLPGSAATRDDAPGGGCLWGWCGPWPTGRWWGGFSPRWVTIGVPVAEACQRGVVRRGRRLEERQRVQLPTETRACSTAPEGRSGKLLSGSVVCVARLPRASYCRAAPLFCCSCASSCPPPPAAPRRLRRARPRRWRC